MFFEIVFSSSLLVITIYFTLMPTLSSITKEVVFPGKAIKLTAYIFFIISVVSLFLLIIKEYDDKKLIPYENYCVILLFVFFTIGLSGIFYITHNLIKKTLITE